MSERTHKAGEASEGTRDPNALMNSDQHIFASVDVDLYTALLNCGHREVPRPERFRLCSLESREYSSAFDGRCLAERLQHHACACAGCVRGRRSSGAAEHSENALLWE